MGQSKGEPRSAPENQLLLVDEQKMVDIQKPHHNDVLCGRGVTTNRHPGNESFRSLVGLNKVSLSTRDDKQYAVLRLTFIVRPSEFSNRSVTKSLFYRISMQNFWSCLNSLFLMFKRENLWCQGISKPVTEFSEESFVLPRFESCNLLQKSVLWRKIFCSRAVFVV